MHNVKHLFLVNLNLGHVIIHAPYNSPLLDRTVTDSRPQSLLCAAVHTFASTLDHTATEPRLWLQENSGKVRNNRAIVELQLDRLMQHCALWHLHICVSLPAVAVVQEGSATRSRWSPVLHRHGLARLSGEAAPRSFWRTKPPRRHGGIAREPSPRDQVLPRTNQSQSAAESGSLVRNIRNTCWHCLNVKQLKRQLLLFDSYKKSRYGFFLFCFFLVSQCLWITYGASLASVRNAINSPFCSMRLHWLF